MIGMTPLSAIAISAYTDLVRLLKDDVLSGVEGKPMLKERGDKAYWYAARRIGTEMRFVYIGEDSDETRARIDRIEELRAMAKERQAERSRLVRILRAEGMTPTDRGTGSILSAMAAAGTFRLGGTILQRLSVYLHICIERCSLYAACRMGVVKRPRKAPRSPSSSGRSIAKATVACTKP